MMLLETDKAWIANKIQSYYKRELYFQSIDITYYLSALRYGLSRSSNFQELETELEALGQNKQFHFIRKGEKKKEIRHFSYLPLAFQCETLFLCWDEILEIQKASGESIAKAIEYQRELQFLDDDADVSEEEEDVSVLDIGRSSYGNKPNLDVRLNCPPDFTFQKDEERKAFPLAVDFRFEYNSFRRKIIRTCKQITKRTSSTPNRDVIFVQTDLRDFFHTIHIDSLIQFLKEHHPAATNIEACLKKLQDKYDHKTLPIGWIISRFLSNVVLQHFHRLLDRGLQKNFASALSEKRAYSANEKLAAPTQIDARVVESLSFVDDFVFLVSIPADDASISEATIAIPLILEAQKLINTALKKNSQFEFYKYGEHKVNAKKFDADSVSTLKNNFAFFKTADEYLLEDSDFRAKIDGAILPNDNDLILNPTQEFGRNIMALQRHVIAEHEINSRKIEDVLSQIKVKTETTGARFIKSVFELFRLIIVTDKEGKVSKSIRERHIRDLFNKCKKTHSYSASWLKFFSGYYQLLRALDFEEEDKNRFFKLFQSAISLMRNRSPDDVELLTLAKNDYVYKMIAETGKVSHKSKAIRPSSKFKAMSTLLSERYSMIEYLCWLLGSDGKLRAGESSQSALWIHIVMQQARSYRCHFELARFISSVPQISKNSGIERFTYSAPRIAATFFQEPTEERAKMIFAIKGSLGGVVSSEFQKIEKLFNAGERLDSFFRLNEEGRAVRAYEDFSHQTTDDPVFELLHSLDYLRPIEFLAAYFLSLRLNDKFDFFRYVISLVLRPEYHQIGGWSCLPLTFQKVGVLFSSILKDIYYTMSNLDEAAVGSVLQPKIEAKLLDSVGAIGCSKALTERKAALKRSITTIDLDSLFELYKNKTLLNRPFKVTLATLGMDLESDLDYASGFRYVNRARRKIDVKIKSAIDEAIRQKSSFLVFPELCLPRQHLQSYLRLLAGHEIVLIGGLEYMTDQSNRAYNATIISVPIAKTNDPIGRGYLVFEQLKNFQSAEENYHLKKASLHYRRGDTLYVFKSSFWGDFSVLTCSDFLSLGLRYLLQGEVQTVFVPAQNTDSVTYDHISESSIRDLHCVAVVCNNPSKGSSHCYAPFYDKVKREIFKRVGESHPEFHTFVVDPKVYRENQKADPLHPFRNPENKHEYDWGNYVGYKQLPPDWDNW